MKIINELIKSIYILDVFYVGYWEILMKKISIVI